ncbi:MAG: CBS domain-containing protein [Streptomycetaceae bacterium]|nr:CBS domain-containing protein [Streptomycetaceae bacterium]
MDTLATAVPTVGSVMHGPVVCIDAEDTLWTAMDVMMSRSLRHLVVTRGGAAVGVLVDRDLAAVWAMDPLGLKRRRAGEALGREHAFMPPETDVVTAATRMRELGVDALVVVDEAERPLGIVTDHDLLGVLAGMLTDDAGVSHPDHRGTGRPALPPD